MTFTGTPPPLALAAATPDADVPRQRHARRSARTTTVEGATIRYTRKERGWSQKALAHTLDISVSYLSQIEMGKRIPSAKLTRQLASWLEHRN
jgi:ribosome-binding protein aMBF1 (putative translation factor)